MVPVLIMNGILAHVSLKSRTAGAAREDANRTSNKGLTKAVDQTLRNLVDVETSDADLVECKTNLT